MRDSAARAIDFLTQYVGDRPITRAQLDELARQVGLDSDALHAATVFLGPGRGGLIGTATRWWLPEVEADIATHRNGGAV